MKLSFSVTVSNNFMISNTINIIIILTFQMLNLYKCDLSENYLLPSMYKRYQIYI